jgi:tripartite-type tricarboxylate transporter receptor subunit TctC
MKRVVLIAAWFVIFGMGMVAPTVQAQPYPNRPIQFIIPGPAGSLVDIGGRMVAEELTKILGVQVVCVNKAGAAFTLGTDFVAKSKKDGYTIVYSTSSAMVYARVLNPESVPYDPDKDLDPLGFHLFLPNGIQVLSDSPWKTFAELIDDAKKNPGKFRIATPGIGSTSHLNVELIQAATGVQFTHVPFTGEAVVTAVLGKHVEMNLDAVMKSLPYIESGEMRTLLVDNKVPRFPQYPTLAELGYKQEMVTSWWGLYGPAGMSEEAKKVLIPAFEKVVNQPALKAKIDKMLFVTEYMDPAKQRKMVSDQYERSLAIAIKAGLRKP